MNELILSNVYQFRYGRPLHVTYKNSQFLPTQSFLKQKFLKRPLKSHHGILGFDGVIDSKVGTLLPGEGEGDVRVRSGRTLEI